MPLNNKWVKEEVKDKIKICVQTNDNDNTTYQNFGDAAKVIIREKSL